MTTDTVVKIPASPTLTNTLWNFGTGYGTSYNNGTHFDDFGSSDTSASQESPSETAQYFIYDTSIDSSGNALYRYNGSPEWSRTGLTVGFQLYPDIGGYGGGNLVGDIAEVIVYSRVLTQAEQTNVYAYLTNKYGISATLVNVNAPVITSAATATGQTGVAFTYQVAATNSPTSFAATGLPSGLSINASTGLISGSPTAVGVSTVTLSAANASGSASLSLTLTVSAGGPIISSPLTAAGQIGQSFQYQIVASGTPTIYSAVGLPTGLTLNTATGLISGTPTVAAVTSVTLGAVNPIGTGMATLTLTIGSGPLTSTGPATATGFVGQPFTYQISTSSPATSYSATGLPAGLAVAPTTGLISGTPTTAGISVITLSFSSGTNSGTASLSLTINPPLPVTAGLALWLTGDSGIQTQTIGGIPTAVWSDLSGLGNNAVEYNLGGGLLQAPTVLPNAQNGHAALRFSGGSMKFNSLLSTATSGELFIVTRSTASYVAGWTFGANGGFFANNGITDDFLSTNQYSVSSPQAPTNVFTVYNATSSSSGWVGRLNGIVCVNSPTNTVSTPNPSGGLTISGANLGASILNDPLDEVYPYVSNCDFAEIIVFSRTLSDSERSAIGQYLEAKYKFANISIPTAPTALQATVLNSSGVFLSWINPAANSGANYVVQRQVGSGAFTTIAQVGAESYYTDRGLAVGTSYSYRVFAQSYAGQSTGYSNVVTATPAAYPISIPSSGLQLWLLANVGVGVSATGIPVWGDQSGLGNNAVQSVDATQPSLSSLATNGQPAVHFVQSKSQYLSLPPLLANSSAGEVFVVVRATSATGGTGNAYTFGNYGTVLLPGTVPPSITDGFMSSHPITVSLPSGTSLTSFNLYNTTGSTGQWAARLNGGFLYGSVGGENATTSTVAADENGTVLLGAIYSPGLASLSYFSGDIAEVIVYNRNLSDSERLVVGQYLQGRYNFPGVVLPSVPTGVAARVDLFGDVEVSWQTSSGVAGYLISRSIDGGPWSNVGYVGTDPSGGVFYDSTVTSGSLVQYQVQSVSYSGQSAPSSTVSSPAPYSLDPSTGLPYWFEADDGNSPVPGAPTQPPTPPSGPPGVSPPVLLLTTPSNATLQ